MALNPSGAISLAGPTAGQSIAVELGVSATATISLNDTNVRKLAGVASGVIVMPTDFWGKSSFTATQRAIFGFGATTPAATRVNTTNLVSNAGVVASDVSGIGTARRYVGATGYGGDKAIFAFGNTVSATNTSNSNLVSNTGVLASDTPGVGTGRAGIGAATYNADKAIFAFGSSGPTVSYNISNLVSNTGVVASNTPGVGQARTGLAAGTYSYT